MPRGGRRRRPDGLASCPEEILQEILVRLPAKSVLRCRAVCRSWRRLTTDPAFLIAHHRHQPTLLLIRSFPTTGDHSSPKCLDAVHLQGAELRPVFRPPMNSWISASCDGLVIIWGRICNPATRQWASLNLMAGDNLVALFHHQPSGEYRVLFWRQSNLPSEVYCLNDYCMLTVGSNKPRRIICSITPVDEELISGMGPDIRDVPVPLHGKLHVHWQKRWDVRYHRILVFDTVAESFRQLRPPGCEPPAYYAVV
uniref:F-box domain-containing protein n=1 Tax=Arundo donax TaxID=35708 RepID=A0A0A9HQX2_ARUDO